MARKLREDEYVNSERIIKRGKKAKDSFTAYEEATDEINKKINNIGGI